MHPLPYETADVPGTGGQLRALLDDFRVEEIPAYLPSGSGDHVFALIEKRGLETRVAIRALARALDIDDRDVGSAGLKDRHAITTQFLSFPPPVTPERMSALDVDGIRILSAARHPHKLRTGHLSGNRFVLVVRALDVSPAEAAERAERVLERLASPPGCPNWFGAQRFGKEGDNAANGRELLFGGGRARGREKRFLISAYQSELFNRYLLLRLAETPLARVLAGDVLQKVESGGLFVCAEPEVDQARLERGEIVPTGPMFGSRMKSPADGSPAAALEQQLLSAEGITTADFRRFGKLALGTRRPLAIRIGEPRVRVLEDAIEVGFSLPSGAYATTVMREVIKS